MSGWRAAFVLALALAGCEGRTPTQAPAAADPAAAKLEAYAAAYNKLIGPGGLGEKGGNRTVLDEAGATLAKAHALSGSLPELDAASGALLTAVRKLAASGDAAPADVEAADRALATFNTALTGARAARDNAELVQLKARGDMLGYNNKRALGQAGALADLFEAADFRDSATLAKADALAGELDRTLGDQRRAVAAAKAVMAPGDPATAATDGFAAVADQLAGTVTAYRKARASGNTDDLNAMIDAYNQAVATSNAITR